jgi:hypothetical protein
LVRNVQQLSAKSVWLDAERKEVSRYAAFSGTSPNDATLKTLARTASADCSDFLEDLTKIQEGTSAASLCVRLSSLPTLGGHLKTGPF